MRPGRITTAFVGTLVLGLNIEIIPGFSFSL